MSTDRVPGIDGPVGDGEDIGRITCYELDEGWVPVVSLARQKVHLKVCDTAGAAVDAAHKWATDRGLVLTWPSMVIRRKP